MISIRDLVVVIQILAVYNVSAVYFHQQENAALESGVA